MNNEIAPEYEAADIKPVDKILYPGVSERVKAAMVDSFLIMIYAIVVSNVLDMFEQVPTEARIGLAVFITMLYDPLCTSIIGATIGHMIIGIKVKRRSDTSKNISLPMAFIRFIVKIVLGIYSLFAVSFDDERKAVHDLVSGSIVLYRRS